MGGSYGENEKERTSKSTWTSSVYVSYPSTSKRTLTSSPYDGVDGELFCGRDLSLSRWRRIPVDTYAPACVYVGANAFWREARHPLSQAMGAEGQGPHAESQVGLEEEEETWKQLIPTSLTGIALLAQLE